MMFNSLHRAAQSAEVNWGPLSLVIAEGMPNRCIHPTKRVAAQSAAEVDSSGIASGHLVVLSMTVKIYVESVVCCRLATVGSIQCCGSVPIH
jgi:hypothetical protein